MARGTVAAATWDTGSRRRLLEGAALGTRGDRRSVEVVFSCCRR